MSSHAGTHMDAPLHFVAGGASIDRVDPALLIGPAYVLDLSGKASHIAVDDLRGRLPEGVLRLLIKTRNSALIGDGVFHEDFIALTASAAAFIAASGVRLLGIDYYSFAPFDEPVDAHRAFLGVPGTAALENADLSQTQEGWYDLVCLPLRISGGEGSPARALMRKREDVEI
jgi:arylformamidase